MLSLEEHFLPPKLQVQKQQVMKMTYSMRAVKLLFVGLVFVLEKVEEILRSHPIPG